MLTLEARSSLRPTETFYGHTIVPRPSTGHTIVNIMCGGGGDTLGAAEAGFRTIAGVNHSKSAIAIHQANFDGERYCEEVATYRMKALPHSPWAWGSLSCIEGSSAGVIGQRKDAAATRAALVAARNLREIAGEPGLIPGLEDLSATPVKADRWAATRATAQNMLEYVESHPHLEVLMSENVVEFATKWDGFKGWLDDMRDLGFDYTIVSCNAAHVSSPGNPAPPQSRDRLYICFTRVGRPKPNLTPTPLSWCSVCRKDVHGVQWFKKHNPLGIGKYDKQYYFACPNNRRGHHPVRPHVNAVRTILDFDHQGGLVAGRAASTQANVAAGMLKYPHAPHLIMTYNGKAALRTPDEPVGTQTTKSRHALIHRDSTDPHSVGKARIRVFTHLEEGALQRFPHSFRIPPGLKAEEITAAFGNAVPVNVARYLIERTAEVA